MDTAILEPAARSAPAGAARRIVRQTAGFGHGPINRLMSPSDLGQQVKPFVFLDHFDDPAMRPSAMPLHPHSGIATLTYLMEGSIRYEDSTGASGTLSPGWAENRPPPKPQARMPPAQICTRSPRPSAPYRKPAATPQPTTRSWLSNCSSTN